MTETRKLRVGDTFAGNRDDKQQRADDIADGRKRPRVNRGETYCDNQHESGGCLDLQEDKQLHRPRLAGFTRHLGIAWIVLALGCALRDMPGQARRPQDDENADGDATMQVGAGRRQNGRRNAAKPDSRRPDDVDPTAIAGQALHRPGDHHDQAEADGDVEKRCQVHAGSAA